MNWLSRPVFAVGFIALGLPAGHAALAADADTSTGPPSPAAEPLGFTLAGKGLPDEGRWKCRPAAADVNGDNILDLAAHPRLGRGPHVWLGAAGGGWQKSSGGLDMFEPSCGGGLDFADVNRDGKADLVVADHCHGLYVYLGDGDGRWTPVTIKLAPEIAVDPKVLIADINPFRGAEGVAVADINGDGYPDLVSTSADQGGFSIFHGDGSGKNWTETAQHGLPRGAERDKKEDFQLGGWANDVLLHDMDRDGHPDLVASYYLGPRVWRGDGKGRFTDWSEGLPTTDQGGLYRRVAVGDINADGRPDLAVTRTHGSVAVYLQRPQGGFRDVSPELPEVAIGNEGVAIGDLGGDARAELVVGTRPEGKKGFGFQVLRWTPDETWVRVPTPDLPGAGLQVIWGISVADFNRDGRNDLAATVGGDFFNPKKNAIDPPLPHIQVWLNRPNWASATATEGEANASATPAGETKAPAVPASQEEGSAEPAPAEDGAKSAD